MPIDDDKTVVEGGQQPAAPAEGAKKKSNLLMFAGIGLGAVIVGVALALFVIKPMMADSGEGRDETSQVDKSDKKQDSRKKSTKDHGNAAFIHEISNIVVNPAGTGGSRFLSVSFGFEVGTAELEKEFSAREPVIRDALITILSSKTVQQLTDPKEKEIVRYQIKKRLSQLVGSDDISGVYFTDFVLQ
ncbi:MAG: flagellar basal body-associated FliL family protein [Candidatus Zixiibacteriota bacterium]|nr:MAG: flagellar basal body-associated FliL family protein [candidate division Zixibacteria bacterium]